MKVMGKVIPLGQKTHRAEWVTRLVQKNDSALRAFLFRLLRSEADAQDVAQESYVDVHISEPNWRRSLTANQTVLYRDAGLASEVAETVAAESVTWRDGVMIIEDQTLVEIVAALNRYSERRIVILDPSLSDVRAGGVVSVRDIRAALEFFENSGVFRLIETSDSFLLTMALPPDGGDA